MLDNSRHINPFSDGTRILMLASQNFLSLTYERSFPNESDRELLAPDKVFYPPPLLILLPDDFPMI